MTAMLVPKQGSVTVPVSVAVTKRKTSKKPGRRARKAGSTRPKMTKVAKKAAKRAAPKKVVVRKRRRLSFIQKHVRQCRVCKSDHKEEIETRFMAGESPTAIADDPKIKVSRDSIEAHIRAYKLRDKRTIRVLKLADYIIDRADLHRREITDPVLVAAMNIKARSQVVEPLDRSEYTRTAQLLKRAEGFQLLGLPVPSWITKELKEKGKTDDIGSDFTTD